MATDPKQKNEAQRPSTAGMTTKVVKGSIWTLAGQILPMMMSLVTAPFTIRLLGAEKYGVLILVGLIPNYLGFMDLGMGMASTKFASEAYASGDANREVRLIRTAAVLGLMATIPAALILVLFSGQIVSLFNVPEHLRDEASLALKLSSIAFGLNFLCTVFNSPQLVRLRMDINTFINSGFRVFVLVATPVVLYLGFGILGAVTLMLVSSVLTLCSLLYVSRRLIGVNLIGWDIERSSIGPLLKFGGGLVAATMALILLVNLEKFALSRMESVEALAYYSVAYTFASMATIFSGAMIQSLIPAFSQLQAPENEREFNNLFERGMRLNLIWLLPAVLTLFVIARPFFTLWAGEDFGRESSTPFYILLFGLFFSVLAYAPYSTITARGRTDVFAKLYWVEMIFYVVAVFVLIKNFGIAGAAAAWSLRAIFDSLAILRLSKRIGRVSFEFLKHSYPLIVGAVLLVPPALYAAFYDNFSLWLICMVPASVAAYSLIVWKLYVEPAERAWIKEKAVNLVRLA